MNLYGCPCSNSLVRGVCTAVDYCKGESCKIGSTWDSCTKQNGVSGSATPGQTSSPTTPVTSPQQSASLFPSVQTPSNTIPNIDTTNAATPNGQNVPPSQGFSSSPDLFQSGQFTAADLGKYETVRTTPTGAGSASGSITPQSMTDSQFQLTPVPTDSITPTPVRTAVIGDQSYGGSSGEFTGAPDASAPQAPCASLASYSCFSSAASQVGGAVSYAADQLFGVQSASAKAGTVSQAYCLANADSCLAQDSGQASFYDSRLGGINSSGLGRTANGEVPNMNDTTFASQRLPLNTVAQVCNNDSGDCTYARVNDTGAFDQPKYGNRIADLTPGTASEINVQGLANITITPIGIYSSGAMAKQVTDNLNSGSSLGDAVSQASESTGDRAIYTVLTSAETLPLSTDTLRGFTGYSPASMTIADNQTNWNQTSAGTITPEAPVVVPDSFAAYGQPSATLGTISNIDWSNPPYSAAPTVSSSQPIADAFAPFAGDTSGLSPISSTQPDSRQLGSEVTPAYSNAGYGGIAPATEPPPGTVPTQESMPSTSGASTLTAAQQSAIAEVQSIGRNLQPGMNGQDVVALQDFLKEQGFFPQNVASTGYYGSVTQAAVAAWQQSIDLAGATGAGYSAKEYGYFGPISRVYVSTLR